ncbi:MAG TPA: DUF2585 family protein [Phycisphaerae bacterium]|nr:DUF2585 family protein [Phycisphaerae bacterium]
MTPALASSRYPRSRIPLWLCFLLTLALLALTAAIEHTMGRSLLSASGRFTLWISNPNGPETSQQLADPYSFTHILHGFLFYALLRLASRRRLSVPTCFLLTLSLEASWEILENSPLIINRYRAQTMAVGYAGDTILNSLSDILCCALGFTLARYLPPWLTILLAITIELTLLITIRDNLTLNILMLIHPIPAIQHWQQAG